MEAHVSDFGLAKLLDDADSHITTVVAGTVGYLAPEYMQSGRATEKSDVYSYGVVLLELLTGRRPTEPAFMKEGVNLVGWVNGHVKDNKLEKIIDPACVGAPRDSLEAVLEIAFRCIAPHPSERPTMSMVVQMLEEETMPSNYRDLRPPTNRVLQMLEEETIYARHNEF
eukprot:TRINITY_DN5613_c0_g1_i2.p1 TRINITY_DN5613_c0_g1~~TRINITY_DN5613_c0_g1_i2.p1  ORF type:complete len:169 (-),score=50.64 TRINITY_DN5613_c0_g1_i2:230-736(-)